jgi:hypothetical protein
VFFLVPRKLSDVCQIGVAVYCEQGLSPLILRVVCVGGLPSGMVFVWR